MTNKVEYIPIQDTDETWYVNECITYISCSPIAKGMSATDAVKLCDIMNKFSTKVGH